MCAASRSRPKWSPFEAECVWARGPRSSVGAHGLSELSRTERACTSLPLRGPSGDIHLVLTLSRRSKGAQALKQGPSVLITPRLILGTPKGRRLARGGSPSQDQWKEAAPVSSGRGAEEPLPSPTMAPSQSLHYLHFRGGWRRADTGYPEAGSPETPMSDSTAFLRSLTLLICGKYTSSAR